MRKAIFSLSLMLLNAFSSLTVHAKKFCINSNVTSTDGCKWEVRGYIDVGCCPSLNGYDITISGPCGTHHFQGMQVNPNGTPLSDQEQPTNAYNMHLFDKSGVEESIETIDTPFFMTVMRNEILTNGWTN